MVRVFAQSGLRFSNEPPGLDTNQLGLFGSLPFNCPVFEFPSVTEVAQLDPVIGRPRFALLTNLSPIGNPDLSEALNNTMAG